MKISLFKKLTTKEEETFRQWARDNYEPGKRVESYWHPAVQAECHAINEEFGTV